MNSPMIKVDLVMPVYNEEKMLEPSLEKVLAFISGQERFLWSVMIWSNGSTDMTVSIGERLAREHPGLVTFAHTPRKGRGGALRQALIKSSADILVYTDTDLSVDLAAVPGMIDSVVSCRYMAVAAPTRLDSRAPSRRLPYRTLISRVYNLTVRAFFPGTKIRDAQVGLKAFPRENILKALEKVKNNRFFFDTELLLTAERLGFRIIQEPAHSIDRRSRLRILLCTAELLSGLIRTRAAFLFKKT